MRDIDDIENKFTETNVPNVSYEHGFDKCLPSIWSP